VLIADTGDAKRFEGACLGRTPPALPPSAGLLVLDRDSGEWRPSRFYGSLRAPWQAILCLESTTQEVGRYGLSGAAGLRVSTTAVVLRLSDGARFRTSATADPPPEANPLSGASGSTEPQLRAWLEALPR